MSEAICVLRLLARSGDICTVIAVCSSRGTCPKKTFSRHLIRTSSWSCNSPALSEAAGSSTLYKATVSGIRDLMRLLPRCFPSSRRYCPQLLRCDFSGARNHFAGVGHLKTGILGSTQFQEGLHHPWAKMALSNGNLGSRAKMALS